MTAEDAGLARRRRQLTERLNELTRRLRGIERELDAPANPDGEERATEREGDEVLQDLGAAGLAEIRAITLALARIENGEYGACVRCGEPIASARLDAVPHTGVCADCARG